jgi:3-oxoacyl-[acyl-carrier protein] reductase
MDKVVVVTGGSGGLGSEIARKFGAIGAKVVLNYRPGTQSTVKKLADEIEKGPGESLIHKADICKYEELKGMVDKALKKWGRIDIVVNAAGGTLAMLTKQKNKLLLEHSEKEWDLVLEVNLKGSYNCLRAVAPQMIKQRDGHIMLVSSGTGIRPGALVSSYAAAKAGVFGLMKAAARELGEYDIKVNAVNPGLITHKLLALGGIDPEGYVRETTLGRLSSPEEMADFVVYLCQKNNISGQIFNLDSRVLF